MYTYTYLGTYVPRYPGNKEPGHFFPDDQFGRDSWRGPASSSASPHRPHLVPLPSPVLHFNTTQTRTVTRNYCSSQSRRCSAKLRGEYIEMSICAKVITGRCSVSELHIYIGIHRYLRVEDEVSC